MLKKKENPFNNNKKVMNFQFSKNISNQYEAGNDQLKWKKKYEKESCKTNEKGKLSHERR
jgi:hypothetical protein